MIYTAIFQSNTIVADYTDEIGDFSQMTKKILASNKQSIEFYVVPFLSFNYYFLHYGAYSFATITNVGDDNTRILLLLQKLKENYISLINKKEKNGLMLQTVMLIKNIMKESKEEKKDDKIQKVENKLVSIIVEKKNQLEQTLEKDALLNKMKEKSNNLKSNVMLIFIFVFRLFH